jgi:hypothetical protein
MPGAAAGHAPDGARSATNVRRRAQAARAGRGDHAFMQNAAPIRRYVLLRHADSATADRWSLERVVSAPREASAPTVRAPRPPQARP